MSNGTQITVHFSCPCGRQYTTTQEQRPEQFTGSFTCWDCKKPVHEWKGNFDYRDWQAMIMKPRRPRTYDITFGKASPMNKIMKKRREVLRPPLSATFRARSS
jgi:hypothetical protein